MTDGPLIVQSDKTVLLEVDQVGPACHTGENSCFDTDLLLGPPE